MPGIDAFTGPDQAALEQMLANFEPEGHGWPLNRRDIDGYTPLNIS
ncbi:hypothetical protein AB0O22_25950 [Streptomyces sp. NPDC091204]